MKARDLESVLGKKKHKTISELRQNIAMRSGENPSFCLFVGAGASRNSGIRTAGEMVQEWRKTVYAGLNPDAADATDAEMIEWLATDAAVWYDKNREYASLMERLYDLPRNRQKFIESEVAEKIPSIGYAYLVRIAEAGYLRTIFTTNFDDLLNEAFYQFSHERAIVCAHDSSVRTLSITSRRTKIIKLHGDYLFEDLRNTSEETNKLTSNMEEKLSELLKEYGLILAGYSGSDKSITRILENLLDGSSHLQGGLYWCFREGDGISDETLAILKKPRSFYVLVQGFDELMAELYSTLITTNPTPFNSKLASDRASAVIDSYLGNEYLKASGSKIIKKHLETLESDKSVSLISDMMKELSADSVASAGLSDQNLLVYLEVERAMKDRNPNAALQRLDQEITKTFDTRFKELLLHRRFVCSLQLHKHNEAKAAARDMLAIEPTNFYVALSDCSLLENRGERLAYLQELAARNPFSAPVLNRHAQELRRAQEIGDKSASSSKPEDVIRMLRRSTEVDPSLSNPAWSRLFHIHSKKPISVKNRDLLTEIVEKHLNQNAYSADTSEILFEYCRSLKTNAYKGKLLLAYLQEAYEHHFPRDYPAHLNVFADACVEFETIPVLQSLLEKARMLDDAKEDPQFVMMMIRVYYDIMRDLPGAITHSRDYLRKFRKVSVERRLLNLYLDNGAIDKAREMHTRLEGAIDQSQWLNLEANIMEHEGRYQDAIDKIEFLPDRRDFDEKHTWELSYLELKMKRPGLAVKRCLKFLQPRSFNIKFVAEIVNYECGKKMEGRNIDRGRLNEIISSTDNEMAKGVCHVLLNEDDKALEIFRSEATKRFSQIISCLRWPSVLRLQKELEAIRDDLLKQKRSFNSLSRI